MPKTTEAPNLLKSPGDHLRTGDIVEVTIDTIATDGRGVTQWGDRQLKVEGAIPAERLRARVFGRRKRTWLTRATQILEPSPHRIAPRCKHFGDCGGCSWQHIHDSLQLELKRGLLLEALKARDLPHPEIPLPLATEDQWFYRNKMDFDFAPGATGPLLGLHRRGSYRTLLDLEECFLQSPQTGPLMATVRRLATEAGFEAYGLQNHRGWLRNLLVLEAKASGRLLLQIVTSPGPANAEELLRPMAEAILEEHRDVAGVLHAVHAGLSNLANPEGSTLLAGQTTIAEKIAGIDLKVGPRTFLQRNTRQASRLYQTILQLANPAKSDLAVDLYCGWGPISLLLAPKVRRVIGIELLPEMVEEAERLARERGAENITYLAGAAEDVLPRLRRDLAPRLLVVNPPRAGIHKKALRALVAFQAPKIVYVSCSPASLADNLVKLVAGGYQITEIQPVDMFPQTPHLETVVSLALKGTHPKPE